MDLAPVTCNNCGAALQVSESARFVTCRYCNAQLEVKRNESTISTEVLQRIDRNTAAMAEDLHAIRRESEIERLDREWAARREQLLIRNKDGSTSTPSGSIVGSIVAVVFGIFWTIFATGLVGTGMSHGAPGFVGVFPLFGVLFVIIGIASAIRASANASTYSQEERLYQLRRRQLLEAPSEESPAGRP